MIARVRVPESLSDLEERLGIDQDDLVTALQEQPDLYYKVAVAYAEAVSERDGMKLQLDTASADLDIQFRKQALENEEKVTETGLRNRVATSPRIEKLERDYLFTTKDANKWQALKEAYQQRSFMLRELVAIRIAEWSNTTLEKGVRGANRDLADANERRIEAKRREQRER